MKTNPSAPSTRATNRFAPALAACGAVLLCAGCATEPESHLVSAPPPPAPAATTTVVTTTPASAPVVVQPSGQAYVAASAVPATSTVVVTQAPPAPQTDIVLARPSADHVWLPGYWTWRDRRYEWVAGHWEIPPTVNATWIAPRWVQEGNAYRFYEGYWN